MGEAENIKTIQTELGDEVKKFEATIKKEPCAVHVAAKKKVDNWNDIELYIDALYQGYLDACRTIHWKTDESVDLLKQKKDWDKKSSHKNSEKKDNPGREPLKKTAKEIMNYLESSKPDAIFEHKKWCNELRDEYENYVKGGIIYGQAQKIINMAFKYLYCIYDVNGRLKNKKEKFNGCHMPLDSFSLEWFKKCFKNKSFSEAKTYLGKDEKFTLPEYLFVNGKNLKADSISSWSSMQSVKSVKENDSYQGKKYPYEFYQNVIKKYCEDDLQDSVSPLQLDFIVWAKMQKIMAAEDFIKAFDGERNFECDDYKNVLRLINILNERIGEVKRISQEVTEE